jgi:hypothetical protein
MLPCFAAEFLNICPTRNMTATRNSRSSTAHSGKQQRYPLFNSVLAQREMENARHRAAKKPGPNMKGQVAASRN